MTLDRHLAMRLIGQRSVGGIHVGLGRAGLNQIDGDVARSEIGREPADHALESRLARAIGRKASNGMRSP